MSPSCVNTANETPSWPTLVVPRSLFAFLVAVVVLAMSLSMGCLRSNTYTNSLIQRDWASFGVNASAAGGGGTSSTAAHGLCYLGPVSLLLAPVNARTDTPPIVIKKEHLANLSTQMESSPELICL